MKFRATTSLNSRLQEMDLIVTMTVIYILIICEGMVSKICYFCPFERTYVWFEHDSVMLSDFVVSMWYVSIDKDCLEVVNTHFDYSARVFHESRFFLLLLFFFLYFPILFFSAKLTLTENSSSPIFSLFSLFSEVFSHDGECFYCCNVTENGLS